MNPILRQYFDAIEARLIESPAVVSYQILRQEIASADSKLRVKADIRDGGQLEFWDGSIWGFSEFVPVEGPGRGAPGTFASRSPQWPYPLASQP